MNQTDIDCSWNFLLTILWGKKPEGSKSGFVGLTSCTWTAWPWTDESSCHTHDFQRETRTLCREDVRSKSASRRPPKATGRTCHRPQNVASTRQLRLTCYHSRPRINSRWQRRLHEGHGTSFSSLIPPRKREPRTPWVETGSMPDRRLFTLDFLVGIW